MRSTTIALAMVGIVALVVTPVAADWDAGDPHKMHFPQLPDPDGWDVSFLRPMVLADDWKCTGTGPVSDIHFWLSGRGDLPASLIQEIHVSIHCDDRTGSFSKPGDLLWDAVFPFDTYAVREYGQGEQGWYNPNTGEAVANDHRVIWQANITEIPDPFIQQAGEIYWLDLSVVPVVPQPPLEFGWKTSRDPFEDDAVWMDTGPLGTGQWQELRDPLTGESLDLAFVITPEPATVLLLGLGGALAMLRRRRNNN